LEFNELNNSYSFVFQHIQTSNQAVISPSNGLDTQFRLQTSN